MPLGQRLVGQAGAPSQRIEPARRGDREREDRAGAAAGSRRRGAAPVRGLGGLGVGGGEEAARDLDPGRRRLVLAQEPAGQVGLDLAQLVAVHLHVVAGPALGAAGAAQERREHQAEAADRQDGRDQPEHRISLASARSPRMNRGGP